MHLSLHVVWIASCSRFCQPIFLENNKNQQHQRSVASVFVFIDIYCSIDCRCCCCYVFTPSPLSLYSVLRRFLACLVVMYTSLILLNSPSKTQCVCLWVRCISAVQFPMAMFNHFLNPFYLFIHHASQYSGCSFIWLSFSRYRVSVGCKKKSVGVLALVSQK